MRNKQFGLLFVLTAIISTSIVSSVYCAETVGTATSGETVNLELRDIDVKSAIESLFRNTGKNFAIDPNVEGVIPSLSFKDVSFDSALKNLTKTAGLTYRNDQGIYIISKKAEVSAIRDIPQQETIIPDEPESSETQIEKIPLTYSCATDILNMMNGNYNNNNGGYGGNGGFGNSFGGGGFGSSGGFGSGGFGGNSGFGGSSFGSSGFGSSMGSSFGGGSFGSGGYGRSW